ncbi:MAG: MBL fold metallo-hydrolase, partial [Actinomycetota bacterium]|nr:MBL fold metallo-hydrolase [Actinomycetota bacterium]
ALGRADTGRDLGLCRRLGGVDACGTLRADRFTARAGVVSPSLHIFEQRAVGPLGCNCYIVGDPATRQAIVIDPGGDADELAGSIAAQNLTITGIVATHAHFDHILAAERLRAVTGAPFHLHPDDNSLLAWMQESGRMFLGIDLPPPPEVDTPTREGDVLVAGSVRLEVLHTPGHSPGSISLTHPDALFAGDTLFQGSVGRVDLPGGDGRALLAAVRTKLFTLGDSVPVYPGHGPATTIGQERNFNPFVGAGSSWTG